MDSLSAALLTGATVSVIASAGVAVAASILAAVRIRRGTESVFAARARTDEQPPISPR